MSQELKQFVEEQIRFVQSEQLKAQEFIVKANGAITAYAATLKQITDAEDAEDAADAPEADAPDNPGD